MRFLADESCDFRVVRALRNAGHDVAAVIEVTPGADDAAIIDIALRERRIFLTEDRDFGTTCLRSRNADGRRHLVAISRGCSRQPACIGRGHRRASRRKAQPALRRAATGAYSFRQKRDKLITEATAQFA
ncbi:MAG: DUF5615 family PIN-like protein [Deltaproteobacteria bacterium]|nr:DUF5615 family PIN-like protein [Deltaproteobacteria bacterium]